MSSNPVTRKAIGLLILVFALGIGFGVLGTVEFSARVYGAARKPAPQQLPMPARAVARMTQDVSLTPEQQKQVSDILTNVQSGYDSIRQQMQPQFEAVRQQGRSQIRQLLTSDQQPKFEEYLQRVDEARSKRTLQQQQQPRR